MLASPQHNFKWPNKIKEILITVGRPDLWENQFNINQGNLHKTIKQTLIDQFKQNWHEQLSLSNKGRLFLNFKENHAFEEYLRILNRNEYLPLLRFRTANHHLPIETGRYDGTILEDGTCNLCISGQVGSEKHYLFDCIFFHNARENFIQNLQSHE